MDRPTRQLLVSNSNSVLSTSFSLKIGINIQRSSSKMQSRSMCTHLFWFSPLKIRRSSEIPNRIQKLWEKSCENSTDEDLKLRQFIERPKAFKEVYKIKVNSFSRWSRYKMDYLGVCLVFVRKHIGSKSFQMKANYVDRWAVGPIRSHCFAQSRMLPTSLSVREGEKLVVCQAEWLI